MPDPNAFNIVRAVVGAGAIYLFVKLLIDGGGIVLAAIDRLP